MRKRALLAWVLFGGFPLGVEAQDRDEAQGESQDVAAAIAASERMLKWRDRSVPELLEAAPLVLRVANPLGHGGSKYHWVKVEVRDVLKNESGREIGDSLKVAHYGWEGGVPAGECTLYLEPYNSAPDHPWKLLGGGAKRGVSHAGALSRPIVENGVELIAMTTPTWRMPAGGEEAAAPMTPFVALRTTNRSGGAIEVDPRSWRPLLLREGEQPDELDTLVPLSQGEPGPRPEPISLAPGETRLFVLSAAPLRPAPTPGHALLRLHTLDARDATATLEPGSHRLVFVREIHDGMAPEVGFELVEED